MPPPGPGVVQRVDEEQRHGARDTTGGDVGGELGVRGGVLGKIKLKIVTYNPEIHMIFQI